MKNKGQFGKGRDPVKNGRKGGKSTLKKIGSTGFAKIGIKGLKSQGKRYPSYQQV